jgi:ABC-type nitrate/sulfonate/bicarbonate transport system substrate-binding protein
LRKKALKTKLGKKAITLIAITLLTSLILSSFFYLNSAKPYSGTMESITLGATLLESTGSIFVAQDQHFFEDNGLNVTIKYYDVGLNSVNAMLMGQVDMALSAEYILVGTSLNHQKTQTIGSIAKTEFAYVVARKDRGIENISDLYGKNVGVVRGTVLEFYLGQLLELQGLRISDVSLVNITLAQSADVIINDKVDAVITFPPYVETIQQQLGDNAIVWAGQGTQSLYGVVTCRNDWITQHPELVKRFLTAIKQTDEYMNQHPNQAKAIVQKTMNFTDDYMKTVWARNEFSLSLDQSLVVAMENEARWIINSKLTNETTVPDFTNYIYFKGLTSVKPESVNVIH